MAIGVYGFNLEYRLCRNQIKSKFFLFSSVIGMFVHEFIKIKQFKKKFVNINNSKFEIDSVKKKNIWNKYYFISWLSKVIIFVLCECIKKQKHKKKIEKTVSVLYETIINNRIVFFFCFKLISNTKNNAKNAIEITPK